MIRNGQLEKSNAQKIFSGLSLYWPANRKVGCSFFFFYRALDPAFQDHGDAS